MRGVVPIVISFLIISALLSVLFFARHPDGTAIAGAVIVLLFGVALPFVRWPKHVRLKPHP